MCQETQEITICWQTASGTSTWARLATGAGASYAVKYTPPTSYLTEALACYQESRLAQ
jgi:hypothetical protein